MRLSAMLIRRSRLWRHRYGMGVHSPFAYRVVRDIILDKSRYYMLPRFERLTEGYPKRLKREYGVIFRLIARLAPQGVRLSGCVEPQMESLVGLADRRPIVGRGMGGYLPGKRILTICNASDLFGSLPAGMLAGGNIALVRNLSEAPQVADAVRSAMTGGWLFADKRMLIAVSDDHEPMNSIAVKMT